MKKIIVLLVFDSFAGKRSGAFFDRNNRMAIIDAKDLPKGLKPQIKMHIEFDDERYEIKSINAIPPRSGYIITMESISNADRVG